MRLFVTGANGVGKTTTARLLANALHGSAYDLDDLVYEPGDPPYQVMRPVDERIALARALFLGKADWVLSGNGLGWNAPLLGWFDRVVLLTLTDRAVQHARVIARERARFGARLDPGGDTHATHSEFMDRLAQLDGTTEAPRDRHGDWLRGVTCPVIRVDAAQPQDKVVRAILDAL